VIGDILQPTHLIFILIVALLVLGPKRLPEVGRSLGRGLRDFKYALSTESPEHDYSPSPEAFTASQPEHQPEPQAPVSQPEPQASVSEPPAEPTVGNGAASPGSGESAPAASGPVEHSS
jgi:sec-independent protein translocase protein TatA